MKILREHDICERLKVSRSTLWRWRRKGNFPRPIRLGENTIGWLEDDFNNWVQERQNIAEIQY